MNYSDELVAFVKAWEGLKLRASGDPLVPGVRDIGYGHKLKPGDRWLEITEPEADYLLRQDLDDFLSVLDPHIRVTLAQHELDALVSIGMNCGAGRPASPGDDGKDGIVWLRTGKPSTLLHRVNSNRFEQAADEFLRWNKAGGKPVEGLKKRRHAERAMFLESDYSGRP